MENGLKEQEKVNKHLLKISKELDVPPVATNDILILKKMNPLPTRRFYAYRRRLP
jgi:DNA polymerase III alpha subunit